MVTPRAGHTGRGGITMIRQVSPGDAAAIAGIYNYYIENTVITFEEKPLAGAEMASRIQAVTARYPWLVEDGGGDGDITGYAYINTWKERAAYRYAAEVSIYLRHGHEGKGLGTALLARLLEAVRESPVHALVAGITLPNERSVALHEKFGFKKIACFKEIGWKADRRLDVGYWELILPERR
jgi:phosphinothricin acetyltransferase